MNIEKIQNDIEWNCNETNNKHCKVVTILNEDSHSKHLKIYPKTNKKGEFVKISGWDNVLRAVYNYERNNENIYVSTVNPKENYIILRER